MKRAIAIHLALLGAAFAQVPVPHPLFGTDAVHEMRLRFAQADWYQQLTANYAGPETDGDYITASFEWGTVKFDSIGVRFKGNSSYHQADTRKKPFRLKLNEFVKGQKIEGIGALNLSNGLSDPSFVREKVYYEMAAALGLKAPRSNFVALYINAEYWGLYVLGEVVNDDFLKSHFGSGEEDNGNLYKANLGANFDYLGEDAAPYKAVWEKQTNEDDDDWMDLIALCKLIEESTPGNLRANLEPIADVDSILTALALDNVTVNLDNYAGLAQNFNIYRRPSDGRWVWIVWDPSLAFGAFSFGLTTRGLQELPPFWLNGERPLLAKLWAVPEYHKRYLQIYTQIFEKALVADTLLHRMTSLRDLIAPFVEADTQKLVTQDEFEQAMTSVPSMAGDPAPGLKPFIEGRVAHLENELRSWPRTGVTLTSNTSALAFSQGASGAPGPQTLTLEAGDETPLPFYSVQANILNGGNWLEISPTGGAVPGSIKVSVKGTGLGAGIYNASLRVYAPEANNSPITIPVSFLVTGQATGVPLVSGILNAASYATGAVAPGEIVTLFGSNLGPSDLIQGSFVNGRLVSAASGVQVTFDGVAAPIIYASANQSSVVVPFEVAGKTQTNVQVVLGAQASTVVTMPVTSAAPGIFTSDATGSGQGAILNQSGTVNGPSTPAAKGSIVSIFFTGAGQTNSAGISGATGQSDPLQRVVELVTVSIDGQDAAVSYSGAVPESIQGLYQVNATVPESVASGPVTVRITVGGKTTQSEVHLIVQ